jgi:hypothetical protein
MTRLQMKYTYEWTSSNLGLQAETAASTLPQARVLETAYRRVLELRNQLDERRSLGW